MNRDELTDISVDKFFTSLNNHDLDRVMAALSDDCVMRMINSGWTYEGKEALRVHLAEFLETYDVVNFHNFDNFVDTDKQGIVCWFDIHVTDHNGETDKMRNTNFFTVNEDGLIKEIIIYTSMQVTKGFEAGSAEAG